MGKDSIEYEVRKPGLKEKAKIIHVETREAAEIYKNTKNPKQVLFEIFANVNGWEGRIGTIPKPASKFVSPKSKMAQFIMKYKKAPEPGMTIDVATNEKGFWALVL